MKNVSPVYATWRFVWSCTANSLWNCLVSIVQYGGKAGKKYATKCQPTWTRKFYYTYVVVMKSLGSKILTNFRIFVHIFLFPINMKFSGPKAFVFWVKKGSPKISAKNQNWHIHYTWEIIFLEKFQI